MTKKIFSIVSILIVWLALGGCAYNPFYKEPPQDTQDTVQTPQTQINSGDQSIKEESKLYSQPDGEYFFKYPSGWEATNVSEQGENYIVTTRVRSATEPSVLIEIGQFTGKEEFNNGNIVWRARDMQKFYDSQKLVSVTEIENGDAWYVELLFSQNNHDTALIGIPQSPKGFFINVKEGWNTSQQEVIEKILGSFSFSIDNTMEGAAVYCAERDTVAKLTITPNMYTDKTTKVAVKTIDKTTKAPIPGVTVWTVSTNLYLESGETDERGLFEMELSKVPDNALSIDRVTSEPTYLSFTIDAFLGQRSYPLQRFNLASNAIMNVEIYFDDQEKEHFIIFDNPVDVSTFIYDKCVNIE
ncbi:MAG: hypothetical protein A3H61_02565 [Candidatus Jacksonbacteria bacterium RIFCSPLOWO2_02_FULL_44_20]|uniref:Uncharacterized protein n=1 Tax=Candidatus Jacksonbacteria bacterium RIFCSPLOWO2_02_FULL_44_20 TaxID=1798460 RepID=A0A1G2ABB8_9BACT|nr:MAG: hypothetical protein UW40_C0031G0003 [Parcubacteria group bacterium GW2011_GWF2_44_17]OGY71523.1 MAG: hypothetical protein A3C00_01985 [Candidatus Jacksonbacteria bacterium RIFCSPHIGHO2_02_FULL_44_25]OGY73806.1 MAG: hypothetical protein A3H61_02565 [Candidatus Jacksonbacteria bacterium RIFCSPLOWO2_02_FULL_44_20]OGY74412.1 MAG: hypothetical protein A3H07_05235 [Candidatus Jacksonbacteria bacterium RIFCSPLOWO2_12_FULL_44_15b]HCA66979.1 hypothetical protein [Candidatus Jacksonbacteria bact